MECRDSALAVWHTETQGELRQCHCTIDMNVTVLTAQFRPSGPCTIRVAATCLSSLFSLLFPFSLALSLAFSCASYLPSLPLKVRSRAAQVKASSLHFPRDKIVWCCCRDIGTWSKRREEVVESEEREKEKRSRVAARPVNHICESWFSVSKSAPHLIFTSVRRRRWARMLLSDPCFALLTSDFDLTDL